MSRMTTSCASFSWARLVMRRACSRDVSVASDPFGLGRSVARAVPVEPKGLDQLRDGWRQQPVDRLAAGDVIGNVTGRDRHRLDLEELDPLGTGESLQYRLEPFARIAGTGGDPESGELEHGIGLLPRQELGERVRADDEDRVAPAAGLEHLDRSFVRVELDVVVGKRSLGKAESRVGVELNLLVPGTHCDENREVVEIEALFRSVGEREMPVVRRIERAAAPACHWISKTPPSTSISSPLRAPAASSAAASSSSSAG